MLVGRAAAVLLALSLLATARASAQDAAPTPAPSVRYPYQFGASSVPMLRNARFFSMAGSLTDRAVSELARRVSGNLFERRDWTGVLARASRLYLADMPIASLAEMYDHEYGHLTRAPWATRHGIRITQWPWPVPTSGARIEQQVNGPESEFELFDSAAGGVEADHLLADQQLDRIYASDTASPFDVALYFYGKTYPSHYIFTWPQPGYDPYEYARWFARLRARPFDARSGDAAVQLRSMRTGAWLNLLDFALLGNVERVLVDHVARGRPVVRPAWLRVGPVRLAPGFTYTPTPGGPQYRMNCRLGAGATIGNAYVRWTAPLQAEDVPARARAIEQRWAQAGRIVHLNVPYVVRLVGAGGQLRLRAVRGVTPSLVADVWRDTDAHVAARGELELTCRHPTIGDGRAITVSIGRKGTGYLLGFPRPAGFYVGAALLAEF